jgi:hypothetical protein
MPAVWNTKFGTRRVRHDPPSLKEALVAAQGLSDELKDQIEIAASLMNLPVDQVRSEVMKSMPPRASTAQIVTASGRDRGPRTVIVEHKTSRRIAIPRAKGA